MGDVINFKNTTSLQVKGVDKNKILNDTLNSVLDSIEWTRHLKELSKINFSGIKITVYDSKYHNGKVVVPKKDIEPFNK